MSSVQGMGELGGVFGGEYVGRRTVTSLGMGPGLRLLGGRVELRPPPGPKLPESERERFKPLEADDVAPTMSISASSTIIMRLSILNGLPVDEKTSLVRCCLGNNFDDFFWS